MKKLTAIFLLLSICFSLEAQKKSATFDTGEVIEYQMHSINPDDRSKLNLLINLGGGLEYFNPDLGIFKATAGFFRINAEGICFLGTKEKKIQKQVMLKSRGGGSSGSTVWSVNEDLVRKTNHGVHAAYSYNFISLGSSLPYSEIAIGYGLSRGRFFSNTSWAGKKPKRTTQARTFNVYSDLLFFIDGAKETASETIDPSTKKPSFSNVGLRVYMDGKFGGGRKRDSWGFTYALGVGYGPYGVNPIASFGLYFGLMQ